MANTTRIRVASLPVTSALVGRRAVVTGATGGLGLATALSLARLGATVVLAVRSVPRGEDARRQIVSRDPASAGRIEVAELNLLDLGSVNKFAIQMSAEPLDLLILNAGISSVPLSHSILGVESQFATNHLGHFALTGQLLTALNAGGDPRVVTVASALYRRARLDLSDLAAANGYSAGRAYAASKLANTLFALELARRLTAVGSKVRSFAAHPGLARTPLHGSYPSVVTRVTTQTLARLIGRDAEPAAVGLIAAAAAPDVTPDLFWGPAGPKTHPRAEGVPFTCPALNDALAAQLWRTSEELTSVLYLNEQTSPRGDD